MPTARPEALHIRDYRGAARALLHPHLVQALYDEGRVVMADVLLTLHGEAHRRRRLTELAVFQRGFLRHYERAVFPDTLAATLEPAVAAGRLELVELGYRVVMNLTADFAGIDRPERTPAETEALLALVRTFSEGATLVHSKRNRAEVRAEVEAAMAVFEHRFLGPSRRRRQALIDAVGRGHAAQDELPRDVLTVLLRDRSRAPLPPDVLRREIAFYLQAGAHSTANATTHAMHEILRYTAARPERSQRAAADRLFLQRCVHESLRLHPASPVAWRRAERSLDLGAWGAVRRGQLVQIDLLAANHDPDVFGKAASEFDPERRLPHGVRPYGLAFGHGVHACLGRELDGGALPGPKPNPERHPTGIVTALVGALLAAGARADPAHPPQRDAATERNNWATYPMVLSWV